MIEAKISQFYVNGENYISASIHVSEADERRREFERFPTTATIDRTRCVVGVIEKNLFGVFVDFPNLRINPCSIGEQHQIQIQCHNTIEYLYFDGTYALIDVPQNKGIMFI